jgi:hypothetical protein
LADDICELVIGVDPAAKIRYRNNEYGDEIGPSLIRVRNLANRAQRPYGPIRPTAAARLSAYPRTSGGLLETDGDVNLADRDGGYVVLTLPQAVELYRLATRPADELTEE